MIANLFRRASLWSFAIYASPQPFALDLKLEPPLKLFNSKRPRLLGAQPHTQADPFLFVDGETLFIFYEQMHIGAVGKIACWKTNDLKSFEYCGVVLSEPHHLSFPFVFRVGGSVYMLPESEQAGQLTLYRFESLPRPLTKVRTLCAGRYTDPILIQHDEHWYLFATSKAGLELFVASDLLTGEFKSHPDSPITTDPRYSRSGGGPIRMDGGWLRVAQDCSRNYGENVSLIAITQLTPDAYEERLLVSSWFERGDFWNRDGAHHLSVTQFKGKTVIAADGKHRDYWINKFLPKSHAARLERRKCPAAGAPG